MAKTFNTRGLSLVAPDDNFLTFVTVSLPEAGSETWNASIKDRHVAPVKFASGYVAAFVNPADANLLGFALEAGQNAASAGDNDTRVVLATPDLVIEGNFLASSAADNVLAAADLGIDRDIEVDANLLGTGVAGWYIQDTTADDVVQIVEFAAEPVQHVVNDPAPAAGDTNARVQCRIISGVTGRF